MFIGVESTSPAQCIASALLLSQKGSDTQDMLTAMGQISTATLSAEGFPHPPVSYKTEKHRLDNFMSMIMCLRCKLSMIYTIIQKFEVGKILNKVSCSPRLNLFDINTVKSLIL